MVNIINKFQLSILTLLSVGHLIFNFVTVKWFIMIVLLLLLVLGAAYCFLKLNYVYWERRGVPGPKPKLLVGNLGASFFMKKAPPQIYTEIYNQYPNAPIVGIYRGCTPAVIIRDPDLLKDVTTKSFHHFQDNDFHVDKNKDPIFGRNPFALRGEEWKTVRTQLTPGFTSGKMKWVYPHMEETSREMMGFIANLEGVKTGEGYEAKELCVRFTLNNVAACAFGLEGKCFEEENSEFRQIAKDFLTPGGWALTVFFIIILIPSLSKIASVRVTPKHIEKRLFNIVSETLKYRKENHIIRNDFLHIMSQLKETCKDYEFTDLDVTAQISGFFVDGHETSSMVMSFLLYELAANTKVQEKLREEIVKNFKENTDRLPYDVLQSLAYLDAVINESLRMHPPGLSLQKVCTKSYTYIPKNTDQIKKPVIIEKDTPIVIPTYGLHHDPKHFDQPETFNPDRFLGANKDKIKKCTFMPFGEGPRTCLGQRFGVLQIKVGVAYIIKNYILTVNQKTKVPLQLNPAHLFPVPVGGIWLDFKKIS